VIEMMATRDDVTVRIDTELREKARDLGINLSRLFEDTLRDVVAQHVARATTVSEPQIFEVALEDDEGTYTGRITGARIASNDYKDIEVFLTNDERVILYHGDSMRFWAIEDAAEELRDSLVPSEYAAAMRALGLDPVIDI
jgi:post-segregation antitoxin CcdA